MEPDEFIKNLNFFRLPLLLNEEEYTTRSRKEEIASQRHLACYYLTQHFSLKHVGRLVKRDHSTVVSSRRVWRDHLQMYPSRAKAVLRYFEPQLIQIYKNEFAKIKIPHLRLVPPCQILPNLLPVESSKKYMVETDDKVFELQITEFKKAR